MQTHSDWFMVRSRASGMLAFMLHRISGIGLVVYLFLHLALLSQLRQGPGAWDGFVRLMRSPLILVLDGILLFGILIHGLNGIRLTLIGMGMLLRYQKQVFWICLGMALAVSVLGIAAMK